MIWSTGKKPQVAPYSGAMLAMVSTGRQASERSSRPEPKNSTNLPTTPRLRSICVTVEHEVGGRGALRAGLAGEAEPDHVGDQHGDRPGRAWRPPPRCRPRPSRARPCRSPWWCGCRCRRASQDRRPGGAAIHLCGPHGLATGIRRFTWWQMPVPGGTTRKLSNAVWPPSGGRNSARRCARTPHPHSCCSAASVPENGPPSRSDRSPDRRAPAGSPSAGAPPSVVIPSRIAARSTTPGTPVKSCIRMRARLERHLAGAGGRLPSATQSTTDCEHRRPHRRGHPRSAARSPAAPSGSPAGG